MKFEYFKADWTTTIEEAKKQYHRLVIENHPDRGGSEEVMKRINAEWDYLKTHNYNIHQGMDGSTYTNEQQDVPDEVTEHFAAIINALIHLEGISIEICGSFIWVSGETYQWRTLLKGLGFKWARRKQMWYLAPTKKRKSHGEWSMDEIRQRHGSYMVTEAPKERETALLTA